MIALRPEMHGEVRPVVVAGHELVPAVLTLFLPWSVLGDQPPEQREVDDDAFVEIGVPERSDACHLLAERPQLLDEGLLLGDLLVLDRRGVGAHRLHQVCKLSALVLEFGCHVVVQDLIQDVIREAVVI